MWTQPELGKIILDLRQTRKMTQEELVERCNLNVRTLQRIESGEVVPRDYTIKAIMSALEHDLDKIESSIHRKTSLRVLQPAWMSGALYFFMGIGETLVDIYRFESALPSYFSLIYVIVKTLSAATFLWFMLGFVEIGKLQNSALLKVSGYLMLGSLLMINLYDILSVFSGINYEEFLMIKGMEAVAFGGINIIFGVSLLKLPEPGIVTKLAGTLEIIIGVLFMSFFLSFMGLFFMIPATILEIIILYQFYEKVSSS